ncbi:MAG: cation diffusion facilitator family transporter [Mariniphaga sp.]|jgi:cobalt-zinc-cadmium efflux system protein|nr:cation diffusion facilitator family transporter [Mariniphaga sp.]
MSSGHGHIHTPPHNKAFALGVILNIIFVVVEILFGLIANSSALLADAGHNASDVLGLSFAWTASWLATIRPYGKYTYGLRKTTILVSIVNAVLLFIAAIFIALDAIEKLKYPPEVGGIQIIVVAGIGVFINTFTALLFMKGQKHDLNLRGAFLHMAADAAVSLGVVISGLLILVTGKNWIDPVMSIIIIAVILWGTWRLFTDSVNLALDAVPKNINVEEVRNFIASKKGVENLHDLHIWAMSTTQVALTAHLVMPDGNNDRFITDLQAELKERFHIEHTTFQIENKNLRELCDTDC